MSGSADARLIEAEEKAWGLYLQVRNNAIDANEKKQYEDAQFFHQVDMLKDINNQIAALRDQLESKILKTSAADAGDEKKGGGAPAPLYPAISAGAASGSQPALGKETRDNFRVLAALHQGTKAYIQELEQYQKNSSFCTHDLTEVVRNYRKLILGAPTQDVRDRYKTNFEISSAKIHSVSGNDTLFNIGKGLLGLALLAFGIFLFCKSLGMINSFMENPIQFTSPDNPSLDLLLRTESGTINLARGIVGVAAVGGSLGMAGYGARLLGESFNFFYRTRPQANKRPAQQSQLVANAEKKDVLSSLRR